MALIVRLCRKIKKTKQNKKMKKFADDELGWLVSAIGACLDNTSDDNVYFESQKTRMFYYSAISLTCIHSLKIHHVGI